MLKAVISGAGLAYLPEEEVRPFLANGQLVLALDDWCPYYPGYHLYYPSRRHQSLAFGKFVEAIRRWK